MNEFRPIIAAHVDIGHAKKAQILAIYELTTVCPIHPHERWRAVGKDAKPFVAVCLQQNQHGTFLLRYAQSLFIAGGLENAIASLTQEFRPRMALDLFVFNIDDDIQG